MHQRTRGENNTAKPIAPLLFIAVTVALDAVGIGLVLPVMPDLINELNNASLADAAVISGWMVFAYSLMQFLCGPLLGNLSDRYGRRPVLIFALIFMGLDYFVMATADALWLLFLARLLSGMTGATYATAAAYLADISVLGERSKNFGYIGAAFGAGFILGPTIGGLLGDISTRLPFIVAGVLALLNALFGYFVLPESLALNKRRAFSLLRCNPFSALLRLRNLPMVGGLTLVLFIHSVSNNVYAAIWSFYTKAQFSWSISMVGLSLSIYGVYAVTVQGVLLGPILKRLGENRTVFWGIVISIASLIGLTVIESSTLLFIGMPLMALGAIVGPTLQGMMSDQVVENEQGELQGVFASVFAISAIISPVLMTYVFQQFTKNNAPVYLPSAPFAAAAVLGLMSLLVFFKVRNNANTSSFNEKEKLNT